MNAEIVARLKKSLESSNDLRNVPAASLLHEVIERYGAHIQLVVSQDLAVKAQAEPQ